jgi:hypothetical protein
MTPRIIHLIVSERELNIIIIGITSTNYGLNLEKEAFELAQKLRDLIRETTKLG